MLGHDHDEDEQDDEDEVWTLDKMIMMKIMMICRQEGVSPLDMHGASHHCRKLMMTN